MLHLRLMCAADRRAEVCRMLDDTVGVAHIAVYRGAAVRPPGDVIEADVARESVDAVLDSCTALSLDHDGAITLETLDTVLSDAADAAEEAAPGQGMDAVVWEELVSRTGEDSRLTVSFQIFLTTACLLAAIGAITDSPVTAVATVAFDSTGLLSSATLDRLTDVDFIYEVGPFSLIVALLAGFAGMAALTSAKSAGLVGVFISVTTVPAAAFASVAIVEGRIDEAVSSILQLVINVVGVVAAAAFGLFVALRFRRRRGEIRPLAQG